MMTSQENLSWDYALLFCEWCCKWTWHTNSEDGVCDIAETCCNECYNFPLCDMSSTFVFSSSTDLRNESSTDSESEEITYIPSWSTSFDTRTYSCHSKISDGYSTIGSVNSRRNDSLKENDFLKRSYSLQRSRSSKENDTLKNGKKQAYVDAGFCDIDDNNASNFSRGIGRRLTFIKRDLKDRFKDETDSGYHTGDHSLLEKAKQLEKIDGERTLCRAELKKSIDEFNLNKYGLQITLVEDASSVKKATQSENIMGNENFFQGFIRVFMNLMRPISMSLNRPLSIYDALSKEEKKQIGESSTQSFYLPKDTSKVIHISSDTSTQEVITILLQKYNITDNPHKFALYEKTSEIDDHSRMRRITNNEFPLEICLLWSSEGLQNHRFVLQENDTQEVVWDAFSVPELENFLKILDREEKEYVEQIKAKYNLLHIQISHQCSTLLENERQSQSSSLGVNKITDNKEKTIKITNDGQAEVFV